MEKPTIILATSNGVGMGHLARASAIALALKEHANPIIVSMAGGIAEIPEYMGIRCEYIPGRDRMWMTRDKWDVYLRDRLLALVDETGAKVMTPKVKIHQNQKILNQNLFLTKMILKKSLKN